MHQNHHNFKADRHLITSAKYITAYSVTSILGTVGGIILKCIFEKKNVTVWTGFNWLITRFDGILAKIAKHTHTKKQDFFFNKLRNYQSRRTLHHVVS